MRYILKREVGVCETGLVIPANLFWLAASPDGLLCDSNDRSVFGFLKIKCRNSKQNISPAEIIQDEKFYVGMKDGIPYLKKTHPYGYYTQI